MFFFVWLHTDQNSSMPSITTVHPPLTLTTILIPPFQSEYEKLPILKPVSESLEKTTTMAPITNAPPTTSSTSASNQTSAYQQSSAVTETSPPSAPTTTTESVDRLTTDFKIGDFECTHTYQLGR